MAIIGIKWTTQKSLFHRKHNYIKTTYIRFSMMSTRRRSPFTRLYFMFVLTHPGESWTTWQHSQRKVKVEMGQANIKHPLQRYHTRWGRSKMQLQQIHAETQLTKLQKLTKNKININNKIKMQKAVQKNVNNMLIMYMNFYTRHLHNAIYCHTHN